MTSAPDPFIKPPELVKEGVSDSQKVQAERTEIVDLDLSTAKSLSELTDDYAFYTPALLHLTVPLQFDPFDLFCQEYNQPVTRFTVRVDKPVFFGLDHPYGDHSWNYVLFGIAREHWDAYRQWMGTLAFNDRSKNLLRRIRTQDLVIRDPVATEYKALPVTAFVMETNRGSFFFKTDPITGRTSAQFDSAMVFDDTTKFAQALAAGSSNPYNHKD
jgi:hypothetical protein